MGSPLGPAIINLGDKVKDVYVVKKKLGEGSCGMVYLVKGIKDNKACFGEYSDIAVRAAMKVEPFMKSKDDEILKMEVFVLKKMQKSKHVCRLLLAGKMPTYSFLVMSLLGKEIADIRRRFPERKMPLGSVAKIGIQCTQAIEDLHKIGFLHRDIKPTNFAMGHEKPDLVYMFDFGLARQIMFPDKKGILRLREPRKKVPFRGTVRYCSINVHMNKEQGRHDDLWSLFYMLIELITSTLPWKGMGRRDSGNLKEIILERVLLKGCPNCFGELNQHLKSLTYADVPDYGMFKNLLLKELTKLKMKPTDPFEWNLKSFKEEVPPAGADKDLRAEIDKEADRDTSRLIESSVESAATSEESEALGFAAEDTLDVLSSTLPIEATNLAAEAAKPQPQPSAQKLTGTAENVRRLPKLTPENIQQPKKLTAEKVGHTAENIRHPQKLTAENVQRTAENVAQPQKLTAENIRQPQKFIQKILKKNAGASPIRAKRKEAGKPTKVKP